MSDLDVLEAEKCTKIHPHLPLATALGWVFSVVAPLCPLRRPFAPGTLRKGD